MLECTRVPGYENTEPVVLPCTLRADQIRLPLGSTRIGFSNLTHLLFHTSSTVGVGQLVRISCDPVKAQKRSQRSPLLETITSWPFFIVVLSVVSHPMTDATNRNQSGLFRNMHIHHRSLQKLIRMYSNVIFQFTPH